MPTDLIPLLRRRGPLPAGELARELGVSRPTLMRAVRQAGESVIVRGRTRATTYAARRPLRGALQPLPIYRVDQNGGLHQVANLDLCHPRGGAVDAPDALGWPRDPQRRAGWFERLPCWLQDMRPDGFLGRHFARAHADVLQVPEDPARWSDDDALHALSLRGADTPGDLIVGETAARLWLQQRQQIDEGAPPSAIGDDAVAEAYPRLAAAAMAAGMPGAMVGGEFPKFAALRRSARGIPLQHVLVKFSGSDDSQGTRRWADLLVCERLAAEALRDRVGIPAARSRVHRAAGRTFLEIERFDRQGVHGRSPVATGMAIDADRVGAGGRPWPQAVRPWVERGWLTADDARRVLRLWLFGRLIANTDMHDSNLAFQPRGPGTVSGLTLAPAYDMLPMLYAPVGGFELPQPTWTAPLPLPHERDDWHVSALGARWFWERAAADPRISDGFRRICEANAARVRIAIG